MKTEQAIGEKIAWLRKHRQMTQAGLGEALAQYLGKPWSRQTVHTAEKGGRAFTATELVALALALDAPVPSLFLPFGSNEPVTLPSGHEIDRASFRDLTSPASNVTQQTSNALGALAVVADALRGLDESHKTMGDAIRQGYESLRVVLRTAEAVNGLPEGGTA